MNRIGGRTIFAMLLIVAVVVIWQLLDAGAHEGVAALPRATA
jgi:hypothetical protein